ncbi:hypothetical protein GCM10010428_45930 [Actinosynnema pretiosum subsp. pretiosum]
MITFSLPGLTGPGRPCGSSPQGARLKTNGAVCVLVVIVLVVLQRFGMDPFAALGVVGAAGWVTSGLVPNLLGADVRLATTGAVTPRQPRPAALKALSRGGAVVRRRRRV